MAETLSTDQIVKSLIFQQFYYGNNVIYGRTKDISVELEGVDPILQRYQTRMTNCVENIVSSNYSGFVQYCHDQLYPIQMNQTLEKFDETKEILGNDPEMLLVITTLLGDVLNQIQKTQFEKGISMILSLVKQNNQSIKEEDVRAALHELYGKNNKGISLLYSLMYLAWIAEIENAHLIFDTTMKHVKNITKKISQTVLRSIKRNPNYK